MHLPTTQVVIPEPEWGRLCQDIWSEEYVNGFLIHEANTEPIQLRYRGGHTRNYPKKSFEMVRKTGVMHFNAEYDDPSMIRNAFSFRFFQRIGVPSPNAHHTTLRLNGKEYGVYLEIEGVDGTFFNRRNIPCQSLFYAANDYADFSLLNPDTNKLKRSLFQGYELKIGTSRDQQQFITFIFTINTMESRDAMEYLQTHLDVGNYLRWVAGAVCTGNYDGFNNNYAIYQHQLDQLYRVIPWDYEGTWGRNCYGKKCASDLVRVTGYNMLTKQLLAINGFRNMYRKILTEILDTSFSTTRLMPEVNEMMERISESIRVDRTRRWPFHVFANEVHVIRQYIQERRNIIFQAMKAL